MNYRYKDFYIKDTPNYKSLRSENANFVFDKRNGTMHTWGKTLDDDAEMFPAPTICDMEVTTICDNGCPFCYKSNTTNGKYMTFETFKEVFDKLPESLTQIAFGADARLVSNPDLFKMTWYAREHGVIPNITAANIDKETAARLSAVCGAVAVSVYEDKNIAYESVKNLIDAGLIGKNTKIYVRKNK
jgi:MoaA/NifB/PqqE/SkfB family radical SAM enzyme